MHLKSMVYILPVISTEMIRRMLLFVILLFTLSACDGQTKEKDLITPRITTVYYKLGDKTVPLKIYRYGDSNDPVYVNMHDDERTSLTAAQHLLQQEGGLLIRIENNSQRNIGFRLEGHHYTFDPNRMFSREGIHQTLMNHGRQSEKAIESIEYFAARFLELIPPNPSCIIALHNNTDGKFSVESYLAGNDRHMDAKAIHINPSHDPDDFFLTTDSSLFSRLAGENFNSVLQNNATAKKDGSLSIWCGEKNINYLNCETQHGRLSQYKKMIVAAEKQVRSLRPLRNIVSFTLPKPGRDIEIVDGAPVWFGEKTVGVVKRNPRVDSRETITGQLEINRDFPIYSNMDFFLLDSASGSSRLEVRVDPTRKKVPITNPVVKITYRHMP